MDDYQYFLKKVDAFHGSTCVGIALGTRITLAAMKYLGLDPHQNNRKKIIALTEIDRCMTDAVQVLTGCSLGRRSLKHIDYGRFAVTLVNLDTGKAVRGTVLRKFSSGGDKEATLAEIAVLPDEGLVTLQPVQVEIPAEDMPGPPTQTVICAQCGERVVDGRHLTRDGVVLCRACGGAAYYAEE